MRQVSFQKIVVVCATGAAFLFFAAMIVRSGFLLAQRGGLFNPLIVCDAPLQDFGVVDPNTVYRCAFEIENQGSRPLIINRIRVGCSSCLKVINEPATAIAPGGTKKIEAEFTSPGYDGTILRTLTIYSNDPVQPSLTLKVKSTVEPD